MFFSTLIAKMKVTSLRRDPVYHTAYVVCNTIVMGKWGIVTVIVNEHILIPGIFPLLALGFLNWRIINAMNAATRRHNNIASLKR